MDLTADLGVVVLRIEPGCSVSNQLIVLLSELFQNRLSRVICNSDPCREQCTPWLWIHGVTSSFRRGETWQ